MSNLQTIFDQTSPNYLVGGDQNFPVSKLRLFMDVMWQAVTQKPLTDSQKITLKQLIDLLNLLDEHKHKTGKELIASMSQALEPLLQTMPTLGLTGTHTFTHLIPLYHHYLPTVEEQVKAARPFTPAQALLYYEATIFDHLFFVHLFEEIPHVNMIELLLTIKAVIITNALVYDYHQHVGGKAISFFTFLERGGKSNTELHPFLVELVSQIKNDTSAIVTNQTCLDVMEFLTQKLMLTTQKTEEEPLAAPVETPTQ